MRRTGLVLALGISLLATTTASASAAEPASAAESACRFQRAWPSFAEVARTARSIYLVKVTESVDGIAMRARTTEVMRGAAPSRLDLERLKLRRTRAGCPKRDGPYARVGDRLIVAYDGITRDGEGSIDAVAYVGRKGERRGRSRLERLTLAEARAYDAPGRHRSERQDDSPLPLLGTIDAADLPRATATVPDLDVLWSCDGDAPGFPRSALEGPLGVEQAIGPVYDGLRRALGAMRPEFVLEPREDRPDRLPWLLAYADEDEALFLVQRTRGADPFAAMTVEREGGEWSFGGYRDPCRLRPLITHGMGRSTWRVDAESPPGPTSTTFPIEVLERACASGRPADGRIADPIVEYGEDAITVTIPVRQIEGGATCPGNPWTPFVLELDEPIGDRALLDGGPWPPEPRWPEQ